MVVSRRIHILLEASASRYRFHSVSFPHLISGTLVAWLVVIILAAVTGNARLAAVNTRDLLHISVPINGMDENSYMDALFFQI